MPLSNGGRLKANDIVKKKKDLTSLTSHPLVVLRWRGSADHNDTSFGT